jgi:hypothetical protein
MANARGRRSRCRLPLRWIAKGRVASSKLMIGLINGMVATAGAVEAPAVATVEWPKWGPQARGRTLLILDLLLLSHTHPPILFFDFFAPDTQLSAKNWRFDKRWGKNKLNRRAEPENVLTSGQTAVQLD